MSEREKYRNPGTSLTPALIIYLLDISGSMGKPMTGGKTRLETVLDALNLTFIEMIARSIKQEEIAPRYRIALYLYSEEVYDAYDGIKTIVDVMNSGLPDVKPQTKTNMAAGFHHVLELLKKEIASWNEFDLQECPAPLVVHMTDVEITERFEDPLPFTKQIREIQVPDGNVLIENIFITDSIKIPVNDLSAWSGFPQNYQTGNPFTDKFLKMSSVLPESYREEINKDQRLSLDSGTLMMYPGMTPDIIQRAFAMSGMTGVLRKPLGRSAKPWIDDN